MTPRQKFQACFSTRVNGVNHMFLFRGMSKNQSSLLQVLTKYFQKRLWKIRSNNLTSMVVVEVNPEPFDLLKNRGSYQTSNHFQCTLYKHSSTSNKGKCDNSQKVGTLEIQKETNLSIGGFLASHHQSPLTVCFPFLGHLDH